MARVYKEKEKRGCCDFYLKSDFLILLIYTEAHKKCTDIMYTHCEQLKNNKVDCPGT